MRKSPSVLALAVVALAAPSLAQQQGQTEAPEAKLEEIVVTARLRAERLQDVPASIAAFASLSMPPRGFLIFACMSTPCGPTMFWRTKRITPRT